MEKVYIEETQSFKWLAIIPAMLAVFLGVLCFMQVVLKKPLGNHTPDVALIFIFLLSIGVVFLFTNNKLITAITNEAIHVSFGIFTSPVTIPLANIKSIVIREYDGLNEFLGWGVKFNARETCYTVSGTHGIEIELTNSSEKILIGTQKPAEMQRIIDLYLVKR